MEPKTLYIIEILCFRGGQLVSFIKSDALKYQSLDNPLLILLSSLPLTWKSKEIPSNEIVNYRKCFIS